MASTQEKQLAAARKFLSVILDGLTNEKGVHAETAITSAGRMAGTFLLRSFNLPIERLQPGAPVLSSVADEKGPALVNLLGDSLRQMNVPIDPERLQSVQGQQDQPQLGFLETQALLESDLSRIKEKYGFAYEEAAYAAAITTAFMIGKCSQVVDPHVGFNVAAYSFVEGVKTVPQRLEKSNRPWYKLW